MGEPLESKHGFPSTTRDEKTPMKKDHIPPAKKEFRFKKILEKFKRTPYDPSTQRKISIRRSEPMMLCDLYIQPEAAFEILSELGEMGCIEIIDIKEDVQVFQRDYVAEVRRFDEIERKLRYLESQMIRSNIKIIKTPENPQALHPSETLFLENYLDQRAGDIMEISVNERKLMKSHSQLGEMLYVLDSIGPFLGDDDEIRLQGKKLNYSKLLQGGQLFMITGVVLRRRSYPFETMLWRISRGNIYYKLATEDKIAHDSRTGLDVRWVAFLAICQGEELNARAIKVCNGFHCNLYTIPKSFTERMELSYKLSTTIDDLDQVLKKTKFHKCKVLRQLSRQWSKWEIQVKKAAAVYHNLNRFNYDVTKNCLIGRCWVPECNLVKVQDCLEAQSRQVETNIPSFITKAVKTTDEMPPIYYATNKFTAGFQALIDAYGAAKYRELNPGLFTIISFPVLFAIMFGDMGHGMILVVFASWMIYDEKKFMNQVSTNEIWNIMFAGRYIILLLGLFSVYTGFLYNDIFSIRLALASCWLTNIAVLNPDHKMLLNTSYINIDPKTAKPYAFGMDPIWMHASNKIMFENSIKMKMSIIMGVTHMEFGVILSLFNFWFFKHKYLIFLKFIPEILLLTFLFAWLVILIYLKWFLYSGAQGLNNSDCAPQLLIIFIEMFLMKETQPVNENCKAYLFPGQRFLQMFLLCCALLCVPVMLLGPPLYETRYHKKKRLEIEEKIRNLKSKVQTSEDDEGKRGIDEERLHAKLEKHTVSMGDLMIHQAIHTIEFTLSTVSHTASYLRLWALSLAHSALSEMLWHMILAKLALKDHTIIGAIKLVAIFAIWAFFTISILVVMEGLSAFLHTLRLHWVEFMTKFFEGGGTIFRPYCFKEMIHEHSQGLSKGNVRKHHGTASSMVLSTIKLK